MNYFFGVTLIGMAAIGHALFIRVINDIHWSTWAWHLAQWLPLAAGAVGFFVCGYTYTAETAGHSWFGVAGISIAPVLAACLGYVYGYHAIKFRRNV